MIDKKLLIPVFLVFLFILALLILPALDTSSRKQPAEAVLQTTEAVPAKQEGDSEKQANYEIKQYYKVPSEDKSFAVSDIFFEQLYALWPLSYVSADEFGELAVEYVDIDLKTDSTYLTFLFISELDKAAASKQCSETLFGTAVDSLPFDGAVTTEDESRVIACLDVTEAGHGTLVSISFTIEDQICITDALCAENPWLNEFIYPGLDDNMLVTEGITYTAPSGVTQYRVYSPSLEVKAQAFDWYSGFSDFPGYTIATLNDEQNFFFKQDGCKFNICEYMDSLIKITVSSTLQ